MPRRFGVRAKLGVLVVVVASLIAACSSSSSPSSTGSSGAAQSGGNVTVAYLPGTQPVDIFPMFPPADDTTQEIFWFVEQMWRPLYWFGNTSGGLTFNQSLSLAYPPVFSNGNKTVTIKMKNWKWSDGQPITTRDVEFWINMLKANKSSYANYVPGYLPDNIASVSYTSSTTFSITFKQAYSSNWLLYNQLCLLFPMPQHAWDKTSATGKIGNYDQTTAGAKAVFAYLNSQAGKLSTYNSDPLWQVVDGPFHLKSYAPNSQVVLAANKHYSGPDKPKLSTVTFLNFTSDTAEYNELLSGNIDYGYIPFNDLSSKSRVVGQWVFDRAVDSGRNELRHLQLHESDDWPAVLAAIHSAGCPGGNRPEHYGQGCAWRCRSSYLWRRPGLHAAAGDQRHSACRQERKPGRLSIQHQLGCQLAEVSWVERDAGWYGQMHKARYRVDRVRRGDQA